MFCLAVNPPELFLIIACNYFFNVESAHNLAMGDSATAVNSTALKQNSSPVPNNVNHEPSRNDSI